MSVTVRSYAKINLGLLTAVSAAAGVYMDFMVKDQVGQTNSLKREYASLSDNTKYPFYSSQIKKHAGNAKSFRISQVACYGLAAALGAGFIVSLAF